MRLLTRLEYEPKSGAIRGILFLPRPLEKRGCIPPVLWLAKYNKSFDAQRYEVFKSNYKAITVMNVSSKKQARDSIYEEANRCEMFYVHNRWLGGMLTNFETMKKGIDRLKHLTAIFADGSVNRFPKKERLKLIKLIKLMYN